GEQVAIGLDASGRTLRARGWTEDAGDLFEVLQRLDALHAARVVYTDIARDGMLAGPNLDAVRAVADGTAAAVTASGGVADLDDLRALSRCHPRVDGAIVGKALYAQRFTLTEALAAVAP
ncbi:MAG: bifunctional 1-(5-phosphoribosyl)-5-((5-phosphoribosylamino)methylideneamino)imidazole-4-carboxamide isomerase/phosphoribosylanthranilate isomerase PriA, partial [Actinobacteria bacterium]|nr:bifunctional 1-(5-phosphoribosyl)-5-((5-phosphoribosylamino)methylideneamino)imidazole-4-carboxamide isomerase/phosphoribosylanthranilate isomerase PriA [Actinomycetota bacterium]